MNIIDISTATINELNHIVSFSHLLIQEDAGQYDPVTNLEWAKRDGNAYFSALLADPRNVCFLASISEQPVGFLVGLSSPPSAIRPVVNASLHSMFVLEGFRNQKIGRKLVAMFVEWATLRNAHHITVSAYAANHRAQAFYQRIGFAPRSIQLQLRLPVEEKNQS